MKTSFFIALSFALSMSVSGLSLRKEHSTLNNAKQKSDRWSQFEQDQWVISQFLGNFSGFYLDIGAHDGVDMSNTQLLDERGWNGVCIEAMPTNFGDRTCDLKTTVVSDRTGDEVLFNDCKFSGTDGGNGGLSGILGLATPEHSRKTRRCGQKQFTTTAIQDLLKDPKVPPTIDYVSLDIEGKEMDVLNAFPFDEHCVRTWTVEHNNEQAKKKNILDLLTAKGCEMKGEMEVDFLFTCSCAR